MAETEKILKERKPSGAAALVYILKETEVADEFLPELRVKIEQIFSIFQEMDRSGTPNRDLFFVLSKEVDNLEAFLDDFGAGNNKRFFPLREIVASIRWLAIVLFQAVHIHVRFEHYALDVGRKQQEEFLNEVRRSFSFYLKELKSVEGEFIRIADDLGIKKDSIVSQRIPLPDLTGRRILTPDLHESGGKSGDDRVIDFLMKFIRIAEDFTVFSCRGSSPESLSEESLEKYRSSFNSLQSVYDSYLRDPKLEERLLELSKMRGHVSLILHLLEIGRGLMHVVERHCDKVRKIARDHGKNDVLEKEAILLNVRQFILQSALRFCGGGKDVCARLFKALGTDPEEFILDTKVLMVPAYRLEDFHIRPIMPLTQIAARYETDSTLYFNRNRYDLKSAIEMAMAIPDIREALEQENTAITVQGPRKAVFEMTAFLFQRCGAYEKEIVCDVFETQSALLDKGKKEK